MSKLKKGEEYECDFPFVKIVKTEYFGDTTRWKPGVKRLHIDESDGYNMATGIGRAITEVIAICNMPGRYQRRVFYKRRWIAPDGTKMGGHHQYVATETKVLKFLKGFIPDDWDEEFSIREGELID